MAGVTYIRGQCGFREVERDAWAQWDEENQVWEVGATFDNAYCDACDGETNLVCIDLDSAETPQGDDHAV
jgi:hypothetical protein